MTGTFVCWRCGVHVSDQPLPLGRTAECSNCRADLHVCRMCEYYDTRVAMSCRETIADEVNDKARANFCDYFTLMSDAYIENDSEMTKLARAQLDALFEDRADEKIHSNTESALRSEADIAREQLEQLFASGKKGDI
jgi:hypothetical protein